MRWKLYTGGGGSGTGNRVAKKKQHNIIQLVGAGPGRFLRMGPEQRSPTPRTPWLGPPVWFASSARKHKMRFARTRCLFHRRLRRRRITIPRHTVRPPRPTPLAARGRSADAMSGRVEGGFDVTASHAARGALCSLRNLYRAMMTTAVMILYISTTSAYYNNNIIIVSYQCCTHGDDLVLFAEPSVGAPASPAAVSARARGSPFVPPRAAVTSIRKSFVGCERKQCLSVCVCVRAPLNSRTRRVRCNIIVRTTHRRPI